MEIIVAKSVGFCPGVREAVRRAEAAVNEGVRGKIYCFGALIHNAAVLKKLESKGIEVISDLTKVKADDTVIIRAHGVPPKIFDQIEQVGAKVLDCTCPFVKKIQKIVRESYLNNMHILVAGEENHPEVTGILGYCQNNARVVKSFCDVEDYVNTNVIPFYDTEYCGQLQSEKSQDIEKAQSKPVILVFQTTFDQNAAKIIFEKNKIKLHKTVEIFDTICYTTANRQNETKKIAQICDIVLVGGDKNSSNTIKLFGIAAEYCKRVFFIGKICDLERILPEIKPTDKIGIVTGASVSVELVDEIIMQLTALYKG